MIALTLNKHFVIKDMGYKTPCYVWIRSKDTSGYGQFTSGYKQRRAHKYAYEQCKGKVPKGLELDHLCKVRACINPEHMEAVTHKINVSRGNGICFNQPYTTHCKNGHEFTKDSVYIRPSDGRRRCKICAINRNKTGRPIYVPIKLG